jgi:type IV secretory pathway VirB2 component (pilin)
LERAREVTRAAVVILFVAATATPALADHPGPFRVEGMSPLMTALLTGALAFLVALVVVVVIMVLTRKGPDPE